MKKEFWIFIITMVIGGLSYSIASFSYMHQTFTTKEIVHNQTERMDRFEDRIESTLNNMEDKLDRLIERGR